VALTVPRYFFVALADVDLLTVTDDRLASCMDAVIRLFRGKGVFFFQFNVCKLPYISVLRSTINCSPSRT
jgi:hypothetical protein